MYEAVRAVALEKDVLKATVTGLEPQDWTALQDPPAAAVPDGRGMSRLHPASTTQELRAAAG